VRLLTVIVLYAVLTGCATAPPVVDSPGPKPSLEKLEGMVLDYLQKSLKDPDSLKQFRVVSGPTLATWYTGVLAGNYTNSGWLVCFEYNAKNSYGGYVGVKREGLAFKGGVYEPYLITNVNWALIDVKC
jgi:hypothetical protein